MSVSDRRRARGRRERACRTAPPQEPRGSRAATPPDLCCGHNRQALIRSVLQPHRPFASVGHPTPITTNATTHPHPDEELNSMTRQHTLLGCAAIAVMIGLGLPSLASVASAGTVPTTTTTPTDDDDDPNHRRRQHQTADDDNPTADDDDPTANDDNPTADDDNPTDHDDDHPTDRRRGRRQWSFRASAGRLPDPRRRSACASSAPRTRAWSASPTTATRSALGWVAPGMTSAASPNVCSNPSSGYKFSGLTPWTTYVLSVRAYHLVDGAKVYSPEASLTTSTTTIDGFVVPSAPRSLTTLVSPASGVGSGEVHLRWEAPALDGGTPITDYLIERSADGTSEWLPIVDEVSPTRHRHRHGSVQRNEGLLPSSRGERGRDRPRQHRRQRHPAYRAGAPESLTATPSDGVIQLAWLAPASTGGSVDHRLRRRAFHGRHVRVGQDRGTDFIGPQLHRHRAGQRNEGLFPCAGGQ